MMDLEWILTFQKRLIGLSIIFLDKIKTTLKVKEDALVENPQKDYSKKKSVGVFSCIKSDSKCYELLRARIESNGEVYIFPISTLKLGDNKSDFHLSYHKSGKFHWTNNENSIRPVYGDSDFQKAFELWLRLKSPPCFCLRKGKNLNENEINILVSKLIGYLPFNFNIEEVSGVLNQKKFYRFVLKKS